MDINQNSTTDHHRVIHLYLMAIIIAVGCVLAAFLFANHLATHKNTRQIENLHNREFPLIRELIQLKRETALLKDLYQDAISFEDEFLILEAQEQVEMIKARLTTMDQLSAQPKSETHAIITYLLVYHRQADQLVKALMQENEDLSQYTESAQKVNQAYSKLENSIELLLNKQQHRYAQYLTELNNSLKQSNFAVLLIGIVLTILLYSLTRFLTMKIIAAIKQADRLKESFLLTISHEMRTPLNGIKGVIDLLDQQGLPEEQKKLITIADDSLQGMTELIDDIIVFSEITTREPKVYPAQFDLCRSIRELITHARKQCSEKGLDFKLDYTLPSGNIETDERKLLRSFRQLLSNAIQYTEQGVVSVKVSHHPADCNVDKDYLQITITDDGPGIDQHKISDIYLAFHQVDSGWDREFQGLGLGIPIASRLIQSLGGSLDISNRQERSGIEVTIRIPTPIHSVTTNNSANEYKADKITRALIVEDNRTNQIILNKILQKLELQTDVAENGAEAVQIVAGSEFHIIFMDCQMPVMDGFEATRAIRKMGGIYSQIPIIAVTANARDEDRASCFEAGMNGFLEKPVKLKKIQEVIGLHAERND